jgi:hypothetical protein
MLYAGVGSRKAPKAPIAAAKEIGAALAAQGWTLRSGGAIGMDLSFEAGCDMLKGPKEIFRASDATENAWEIAKRYRSNNRGLRTYVKNLFSRNALILLGEDLLHPVQFVICWTERGAISGGTGHTIRMAQDYQIPVINMGTERRRHGMLVPNDWRDRLEARLESFAIRGET